MRGTDCRGGTGRGGLQRGCSAGRGNRVRQGRRGALIEAGRQDLIGSGCGCPLPTQPSKEAIEARRRQANEAAANPAKGEPVGERGLANKGYRPWRKSAQWRKRGKRSRKSNTARSRRHEARIGDDPSARES